MEYFSQDGQDEFIVDLLKHKKKGVFIDVGAHNGISFSNTYTLEKNLEWTGICVEPNPIIFQELKDNRKCICINCCIGENEGISKFLSISGRGNMLSGLFDFLDHKHLLRIDDEIKKYGSTKEIIDIKVLRLDAIFNKNNFNIIDYCNIDVEGGEMSVLKSIDFSRVQINLFTVENNYNTREIYKFLKQFGYKLIAKIGGDEVYELKSKRYGLMIKWKTRKIKNTLSAIKHRIIKY